ncbi:SurA N-terminal domain-containing protein [bacterium]|nr:SurA N-terminal domain-containing protein [bacterium]
MLKFLRKQKNAKKIFYVLAIIIVPSFIFWGSSSVIRDNKTKSYAGRIFGKKISYDEYRSALHAWRNQLKIKFGDKAHQIETIFDSNKAVWDRLILRYGIRKRKIKVSDEELTKNISSFPFLQRDGIFDPGLYELFLKYSLNTPPRIFEEDVRETIRFQKLFEQITKDIKVSEKEIKERYIGEYEQIKAKYICALSKELEKEIILNEEELKENYDKHKEEFIIPIQIKLNYIGIDIPQDASDEVKREINEKINELQLFLNENNDLIKIQEESELQIKETGFLALGEPVLGKDWPLNDLMILFNLKQNQITDIIQTPLGPYIFQLKEKRLDYQPSFEEVKEKIKINLTKQKSKEVAKTKMDNYHSQIKAKKQEDPNLKLSEIATQLNLSVKETDFFSRNSAILEIGSFNNFNDAAFNLGETQTSEVIELPQGYFVAIEISEHKPINEEDFNDKRDNLKTIVLDEKKNQVFEEFFMELKAKSRLIDYIELQQAQQAQQATQESD